MDPLQQFGISSAQGAKPGGATANQPQVTEGSSPSFHALLEKLEQQAGNLQARDVANATNLAGAMDEARESLEGALELGRDLIEAYREAQLGKDEAA
ncbi:MAG: hypothetical protein OSB10_10875 [Planctomycetota bacterium]|nr:hypothetical protein [Planctomycetota bacterium]